MSVGLEEGLACQGQSGIALAGKAAGKGRRQEKSRRSLKYTEKNSSTVPFPS